jgi:hypothetical protein
MSSEQKTRGAQRAGEEEDDEEEYEEDEDDDDEEEAAFSGGAFTGAAGYTANDEKWAADNPDPAHDKEEYDSLMRALQKRKEADGAGPSGS